VGATEVFVYVVDPAVTLPEDGVSASEPEKYSAAVGCSEKVELVP
jgi:hypothetical protein